MEGKNFENFPNHIFSRKLIYLIGKNGVNTVYHVWREKKFWKFPKSYIFEKIDLSNRKKCPEHGLSRLEWKNFENFPNHIFSKKLIYRIEKNVLNTVYHVWREKNFENFPNHIFSKKLIYLIEKNVLNTVYHVWSEKILKISQIIYFRKN